MSVPYWQTSYVPPTNYYCDILIIGRGIAGLSTAYWLTKLNPGLSIQILDKDWTTGASTRNAGFITCGSTEHFSRMVSAYGEDKAFEIWKFTEYNHELMIEELGSRNLNYFCDYRQQGSWTLASTEHEAETIQKTVKELQKRKVEVEWFNEYHIQERFRPHDFASTCVTGFLGGAHYYKDGDIHPVKYVQRLKHQLHTKDSFGYFHNSEVYDIESKGAGLVVKTPYINWNCDAAVLCTNAWTGQLFPWFKDKISPMRGQIIVTEPVVQFLEPCYCSFVLDYFRQLVDGSVLIGGFRNADVEREVGYSDEINPTINTMLENFLNKHFPLLRGKKITHRWSGVMGFAADGYPMIGSLNEEPRIYYNVGFTAHGLGFAFGTGELTAKLILEGKDPGIFSGRRFN